MKKRIRCPENLQDARYTISLIEHVQQHSPLCLVAHWCLSCWCLRLCLPTVDYSVKTPQSIGKKVGSSWTTDVTSAKPFSPIAESWKSSLCGRCSGFSCLRETTARVFKRDLNLVALFLCPLENTKYSNPKSRLKIADNDSQCHSSITFAWHFPSPNQSCNQDQMSQFDASAAAGVSWGVSVFAFRREQVHSKEIGWQPWLHWKTPKPTPERNGFQGLFSSVAVCGSLQLVQHKNSSLL